MHAATPWLSDSSSGSGRITFRFRTIEILQRIKRPAGAEKRTRKSFGKEILPTPSGLIRESYRVGNAAFFS